MQTSDSTLRSNGIIWLWSFFGVVIITLFINNWLRWVGSSDFVRPDPGADVYPYLWALRGTELLSCGVFILLFWYTVIRPIRRGDGLGLDGKLFIGGVFASTLDIFFHSFNPTWAMNAYAYSFGTWANFIPGFPGAAANDVPWGLLWCLPAYIWLGVGAAIVGSALLRWMRNRFSTMSTTTSFCLLQLIFMLVFFAMATFWNRTEVYTYLSVPRGLTFWYGEVFQLPIYEPFCIAAYCTSYTWLRESVDVNGYCSVDRELDSLKFGKRSRQLISTLAICGYCAVTTMATYQIPFTWFSMTGDSHPELPSYLRSGVYCGQAGQPLCAGQHLKKMREDYRNKERLTKE